MTGPGRAEAAGRLGAGEVIDVLRNALPQLERTRGLVARMGEEGIRDVLLVALNDSLKGRAFGEAFNGRGRTDMLVRDGNRNVYLVECKTYTGPSSIRKAIGQLLGYTGWRERHLGLVVFVRHVAMTTAIRATSAALSEVGRSSLPERSTRREASSQLCCDTRAIRRSSSLSR